jgi:hypothetical protein
MALIPTRETTTVKLVGIPEWELVIYKKLIEEEMREVTDKYYDVISVIQTRDKEDLSEDKIMWIWLKLSRMQEGFKFFIFKFVKSWNLETEEWPAELSRKNFDTYIQQEDLEIMAKIINPQYEEGKKKNEKKSETK